MKISGQAQENLFLDALVTYADACTQPNLTPSCPYYEESESGPTCNEQCRDVLSELGLSRPVQVLAVDGLRMQGRAIPFRVISGTQKFDATQLFLQDRDKAPADQSTSSLMSSLQVEVVRNVLDGEERTPGAALSLWGELSRRGIEMDRVFAGGIARTMGLAVAMRVMLEILNKDGSLDLGTTFRLGTGHRDIAWSDVAAAAFEYSQHHQFDVARIRPGATIYMPDLQGIFPALFNDPAAFRQLTDREDISFLLAPAFIHRSARWFANLIDHDLDAALRGIVPAPDLFNALSGTDVRDEQGLWIWERFTQTTLDHWSLSSLMQEWKWARSHVCNICNSRSMAERVIPGDEVAELALVRASDNSGTHQFHPGFEPGMFVQKAVDHLAAGDWEAASRIFEGLVELRPGDGEAWNNLGFCQLGHSATVALSSLQRGAALQRPVPVISLANQVLALHLLNRDQDALQIAARAGDATEEDWPATVWAHPVSTGELELRSQEDPRVYLTNLVYHIEHDACSTQDEVVSRV